MRATLIAPIATVLWFVLVPGDALAGYVRTGRATGTVCVGFIVEACKFRNVDAVRDPDGSLHEFREDFDTVDEYGRLTNICHIRVSPAHRQQFLERRPDGSYEAFRPSVVTFPCRKT